MKRSDFIKTTAGVIVGTTALTSFTTPNQATNGLVKIFPKALRRGDLIGITAPAGSIWNKSHIEKVENILHEQGFKTKVGKTCYEQEGYLAGSDELRAAELMGFFEDKAIKGIVTMRGGWGCQRILDMLNYDTIHTNPKVIIGFSDITSLVNAIYRHAGLVTFHGPCGYSSWGDFTMDCVKKALVIGEPFTLKNPTEYKEETKTWVSGKAQGTLIGGNLTVFTSLIGTPHEPVWVGSILFLEEIGEEPYRVDRMLWQMKQARVFKGVKGLVLGSFKNCQAEEPHKSFSLDDVFKQHFGDAKFPVYQGAAFGHIIPKFTLPIGVEAEMDADKFTIRTLERSVGL
ncbi:MAG: muramoyltetrapeptide carboxypeptidase [Crocinitomix sp.]|jgi:muramoyltetrapeptide carboxypeptidase